MSANISGIQALFPGKGTPTPPARGFDGLITGPAPLDALNDRVRSVVDAVREHGRGGRLWDGDLSDYAGDHSRGDQALCGLLARSGLSALEIDTAFRASSLYRDKWERADYRASTIGKAVAGVRPTNEPAPRSLLSLADGLIDLSTATPKPRDWTLAEIILAVKSCVLAGLGGSSKTQWVVQLAIAITLGIPFMGKPVKQGRVLLLLAEEDREEIARRINAIIRHRNLPPEQIQRIRDNIRGFGLVGQDTRLTAKIDGALQVTPFGQGIIEAANEFGDVQLIVLDHVALFHGGDFNAREDAALTMRMVNHIAQDTGSSVLMLAHSPKASANAEASDSSMVAGSTAFVDQARAALVLAAMRLAEAKQYGISADDRGKYVSLTVAKNNYGPTGGVYWFHRVSFDCVGLLEHVELVPPVPSPKQAAGLDGAIVAFIKAHPGQYSKTGLRDTRSGKDGPFKASKGQVGSAIETLLTDGRLVTRVPTQEERAKFDLGPRVKVVLDIGRE